MKLITTRHPAPASHAAPSAPIRLPVGTERLLRLHEVMAITGVSKSWIYDAAKAGRFPRRIRISSRMVGWRLSDVQKWIDERAQAGA